MRLLARVVAVLVSLAALAVIGWGQLELRDDRAADTRAERVARASATAVARVLSYDYRTLDEDIDAAVPLLTGDALTQYEDVKEPLVETAPELQAVVAAEVVETTVLESSERSARVLLFVDQTSSSTKLAEPQLDQSRIVVTLVYTGDRWLVDTLAAA